MSWINNNLWSSFLALIGNAAVGSTAPPANDAELREKTDEIRQAMIELARGVGGKRAAGLALRMQYAPDLEALWFMRSELMGLLAQAHGEMAARDSLARFSGLFAGLLPTGLRSRPSPLDGDSVPHGSSAPH